MFNLMQQWLGASLFIPHGHCYLWKPELVGLHLFSDALTALAYYSIPLTLFYFVRKRSDLPFPWLFLLFSAFIISCGTTHLMAIWTLWRPTYWISGLIKLITALVSVATAILLVPIVPKALALPNPAELEYVNQSLQHEIEQRQQANLALQASEARLAGILDMSHDAIISIDINQIITLFNRGAESIFGYTAEEVIGEPLDMLMPQRCTDIHRQHVTEFKHSTPATRKMRTRNLILGCRKDGSEFPAEASISQLEVGDEVILTAFLRDISDRQQAETALRESEANLRSLNERLQYLLTHAPVAIFSCQAGGDYGATSMSANVKTILGYEPSHFLNDSEFWVNHIHPDDRDRLLAEASQIFETGTHYHEYRFRHADGTYRWVYNQLQLMQGTGDHSDEIIGYLIDITDRKQAEAAVRHSEAKYRAIVEDQTELIARFLPDGTITFVNKAYRRYFGLDEDELVGNHYRPVIFPEDLDRVNAEVQRISQENPIVVIENRVLINREVRWTQWVNRGFFDDEGSLTEIQAVGRDINDLKAVEAALEQSDRRFRAIFNTMFQFIGLLTPEGILIEANQAALEFGGVTREEVINRPFWEARWWTLSPETPGQLKGAIAQAAQGEFIRYEVDVLGGDDTVATLDFSLKPIFDDAGQVTLVIPEGRDITERKEIEKQLQLRGVIVKNMAEGVCMIRTTDGVIVYTNPKFERMFGYEADELRGKHVSILNYGDKEEKIAQALTHEIISQGEVTYEVHNIRKDGTPFWCEATTSVFEHPDHGPVMVAVQQDMTARKYAAEQLQASLKEKEVLLKEIHHRVKNNLGIVDGLLQMQARRSPSPEVVNTLQESRNRITSIALIHEMLYRSEDLANINIAQYIRDLTSHLFSSYKAADHISLMVQVDDISLNIDHAIPCGLIINELVSNSLKYAFPNAQPGEIHVLFHQKEKQTFTLVVQDNGVGMLPGFDVNQSKTLGMSLIQGLVKQLRGTLDMSSGSGTTFTVTFRQSK
jgi:PAS domain S-box-containing protein